MRFRLIPRDSDTFELFDALGLGARPTRRSRPGEVVAHSPAR
jgi:hypothetical protein